MVRIYADHNATSPLLPAIREEVKALFSRPLANPSSPHAPGLAARAALEAARADVAGLLGAKPEQVFFTASATEANALALHGHHAREKNLRPRVLVSAIEHPAVLENAKFLGERGAPVDFVEARESGEIDLDQLERRLTPDVGLVCVMAANNETGVVQPLGEVAALCRACDVRLHVDAAQALGKIDLDAAAIGADTVALSGHKLGGLVGAGALMISGRAPAPLVAGGGQESGLRPGTESWHAILAFALAARAWAAHGAEHRQNMARARDAFEARLEGFAHQIVGRQSLRLPNTSLVLVPGVRGEALLSALDLAGVAVSHGAACRTGALEPSHVLMAMGLTEAEARTAMRVSFGPHASVDEGGEAAARLVACAENLRRLAPRRS